MEKLEDLFKDYKKITEQKQAQEEPAREKKKVIFDKVVYIIGPNNWEVVPTDPQGNILPPNKVHDLGYQIVFVFPPSLPERARISLSEIEKYQEYVKKLRLAWVLKIIESVYTAMSRNLDREIIFCISDIQLEIFKTAWNTLVEYQGKEVESPEDIIYKSLSILLVDALKERQPKLFMVIGKDKNGGAKYYLIDGILLYSDNNFERL